MSCEPERTVLPSGEKAMEVTLSLCVLSSLETFSNGSEKSPPLSAFSPGSWSSAVAMSSAKLHEISASSAPS